MSTQIIIGDCREKLREIEAGTLNCCVTSPPYFGLRDYGHGEQIGLEASPDAYVAELVEVFREVRRVLRDDGTLWLNIGDSYSRSTSKGGSGPNGKNEDRWGYSAAQTAKAGSSDGAVGRGDRPGSRSGGLGEKQLLGIPWRVAFALQADGWILRQDIIWHKPNPMPESVRDRCTKAHEYVFMLSKSARYFYDADAVAEPAIYAGLANQDASGFKDPRSFNGKHKEGYRTSDKKRGHGKRHAGFNDRWEADQERSGTRNKRSVWTIATQPYAEAHFATMAPELARTCILAGCPEGGTVLDPFGGAGTTGLVADQLQRNSVLIELNPDYADLMRERIVGAAPLFAEAV